MKGELRGSIAGWSKLLTSYDGESIDYDEIGNPVLYRGATLTWDGRELKTYSKNGTNISYKYDADGLRGSKTVNGAKTTYQYIDGQLLYEDRNGTDIYYYYDSYGTPTAIRYYEADGTSYRFYLATNQLGDVIGIYNASGNLVVKYEYDAWGRIISTTNASGGSLNSLSQEWSDINPFRYRGYYYDSETGLYYLNSRYYDSETGRFLNADDSSIISASPNALTDKNLFSYCDNNPVMRVDNDGKYWRLIAISAAFGGLVSAVLSGIFCYIDYGYVNWGVVGVNFLSGAILGALSMTKMKRLSLTVSSAVLSGSTYMCEQLIKNEEIELDGLMVSVSAGAFSGLIGGDGIDAKGLKNSWDLADDAIIRESRRANTKYAFKEIARYSAKKAAIRNTVRISLGGSATVEVSLAFAKRKFGY